MLSTLRAGRGGGERYADVSTHLLVALDKARRGEVGFGDGRKRRANRYYHSSAEHGEAPCCPPTQTAPPALMRSFRTRCQACRRRLRKRSSISMAFQAGPAGFVKATTKKRTTLSPTDSDTRGHAPAAASLRQRRAAQTQQRGAEHIGSVRVEDGGVATMAASVRTAG